MIDSCRKQIAEEDADAIADILCNDEKDRAPLLDLLRNTPDIRDDVLDDPRLVASVMEIADKSTLPPRLYFYVGVRHFLSKKGMNDRELADYLSTMCIHFLFHTPWGTDNPMMHPDLYISRVVEVLSDAVETEDWNKAHCLHSHLGHYLLFFTGLLHKVLKSMIRQGGRPMENYEEIGRAHFKHASNFDVPIADLYEKLHKDFPTIRLCLNELSISSFL